ncbi:MAG: ATP-dependent helicase, partial [Phycisphaerae bacterium]
STQPILSAASALIAHNSHRKDKKLWTRREGGADVTVFYTDHEHAEADLVARRLAAYRSNGGSLDDLAVFYRVNSLSRVLEEALLKRGVAYRIARGVEFYNRKEIKDVLAYLRLLVNPADDLSLTRIINTPTRGIGNTTVQRLSDYAFAHGESVLQAADHPEDAGVTKAPARKVRAFLELVNRMRAELDRPVSQVVEAVFKISTLEASYGDDEDARQAKSNVGELISAAAEFEQQMPDATVADFLHHVGLVSDVDRMDGTGGGAVTLMTLHAAKGLEFPVVYVIGWEEGLLPFQRESRWGGSDVDTEEERRLAFVGMTRAKDELNLTVARARRIRGQMTPQTASPFLDEIGEGNLRSEDLTSQPTFTQRTSGGGFYADQAAREQIERNDDWQMPSPLTYEQADPYENPVPPEYEQLAPGKTVRHPKYGMGKLISLSQPWPHTRATIHFQEWGIKKIVLERTSLDVL